MIKLKQIEAILKKRKTIITMTANGSQWLSDGAAFYPVVDLPKLTKENLFTIFGVPVEKRESWYFAEIEEPAALNFEDADASERLAGRGGAYLIYEGCTLCPLATSLGLAFLDASYLKPFYSLVDGFDIYERLDARGNSYFAIKSGFLLLGVIMPRKVELTQFMSMVEQWKAMALIAQANAEAHQKADMIQAGLFDTAEEEILNVGA